MVHVHLILAGWINYSTAPINTWHLVEAFLDQNNKTAWLKVDGSTLGTFTASSCKTWNWNEIWRLGYDGGGTTPPSINLWMDDVYIDNTQSRVMIGNASTLAGSTHLELQPPTAWNSNGQSVTITVNQGSFADSATAYLYVINANGNVNINGYPITFSSGSSDTTPPTISGGSPTGAQTAGTTQVTLSVTTNENATCKYSTTAGTSYASMANTFSTTGSTSHSKTITGLTNGTSYTYYVRCQDTAGNPDTSDYTITFSVSNPADTTPPVISGGSPSGTLAANTTQATLQVTTDENATCRYSNAPNVGYLQMTNFSSTGGYHPY